MGASNANFLGPFDKGLSISIIVLFTIRRLGPLAHCQPGVSETINHSRSEVI